MPAPTWTYDPTLATDLDHVRYLIGDTDSRSKLVYNEEITAILAIKSNDVRATAISLCESLAARYSQFTSIRAGETTTDKTPVSTKFMERAKQLRVWKVSGYAVITQSEHDLRDQDTERLATNVKRDMDANT